MLRFQWSCDLHEAAVLILALLMKDFSRSDCIFSIYQLLIAIILNCPQSVQQ